ncbi:MAG: hypothetical protein KH761_06675, partial [Veillonella sp.]|nr:hypothetical protein [Veillonella sp.]
LEIHTGYETICNRRNNCTLYIVKIVHSYIDIYTYGIVTYGALWQLWKDEELLAECNDFLPLLENLLINGRSLKDIIAQRECGLLLM